MSEEFYVFTFNLDKSLRNMDLHNLVPGNKSEEIHLCDLRTILVLSKTKEILL